MQISDEEKTGKTIAFFGFLILIGIAPFAIDPINSVKFQILVVLGLYALITLSEKMIYTDFTKISRTHILISGLLLFGFVTLLIAPGSIRQQLFGTFGRNNGFITFMCLILVLLVVAELKGITSSRVLLSWFSHATTFSAAYGLIQILNLDPVNWSGDGVKVVGFLGNTNFQSSLMALGSISLISRLGFEKGKGKDKILLSANLFLHVFVLFETGSIQGYFVLLALPLVILLTSLHRIKLKRLRHISVFIFYTSITVLAFIFFAAGKLLDRLGLETISFRRNYWAAALGMLAEHPFFGVGFDSYGDWYRKFRPENVNTAYSVVSNSAHNYFLDIGSNLGTVALILFVVGLIYIFLKADLLLRKGFSSNLESITIVALFLGLVMQSLISPVQIGLVVWMYILAGKILAISEGGSNSFSSIRKQEFLKKHKSETSKLSYSCIIGLIISAPVFLYQIDIRSSLDTQDFVKIEKSVLRFPLDPIIVYRVAEIAEYNKLYAREVKLLKSAVKSNENFYEAWEKLYLSDFVSGTQKDLALIQMKRLEPKWNVILANLE
jgi:O-antigen ligase